MMQLNGENFEKKRRKENQVFQCSCEPLLDFLILLDVLVYKSCYVTG